MMQTSGRIEQADGPRPLVVRFGALGDMVLIQPLIRQLSARYGAPVDILSAGGWTRKLYEGQPGVGEIMLLKHRKLPYWLSAEKKALVAQLRQQGPRPVWYCDGHESLLPLLARAGLHEDHMVRTRIEGFGDGHEHLVEFAQRIAAVVPPAFRQMPLQPMLPPQDPVLAISPAMVEDVERWLQARQWANRPLLLVQVGNRRTMRTGLRRKLATNTKWWPETNWATVIQMLAQRHPEAAILLIGAPAEAELNDELLRLARADNVWNVANELPIPRLLALQARAAGMISVDTGPAHTAAALGCPLVVLFGVANPAHIRPRGGDTPVLVLQGETDGKPDMTAIGVEDVICAWQRLPLRGMEVDEDWGDDWADDRIRTASAGQQP